MGDSHTFEHNGHTVEYSPATVRTSLDSRRYLVGLITAYGYESGADASEKNPLEWENFKEYAASMAQCKTSAPWRVSPVSSPEDIQKAYECFLDEDAALHNLFITASLAVSPPKKTVMSTPQT
jgi:hypothetical protein